MQELVKQSLEDEFGTKVTIQGKTVKTTVSGINGNELLGLGNIYRQRGVKDINLKRSGTSITVLVVTE